MSARKTHGMSNSRLYRIRQTMIQRCTDKKFPSYKNYGGKGIIVCNEWMSGFSEFMKWSLSNGYSDHLTIDRVDPNGNYEPSNCRWVSMHTQILNQDRNSWRTKDDKYIKYRKDGRFAVVVLRGGPGNRETLFSMVCDTIEDAKKWRDIYLLVEDKEVVKKISKILKPSKKDISNKRRELKKINGEVGYLKEVLKNNDISTSHFLDSVGTTRQNLSVWAKHGRVSKPFVEKVVDFINRETDENITIKQFRSIA